MANYLYTTTLYQDTSNVSGANANNDTWLSDYETNNQSSTIKIETLEIAETTFMINVDYNTFDGYITGDYAWSDVKEVTDGDHYTLYLVTQEVL